LAIFTFAGIVGVIDIRLFHRVREIVRKRPPSRIGMLEVIREPLRDRQFIHLAGAFATMTFGTAMSMPFFALTCQRHLNFNNLETMVVLAVCPPIGSLISSNLWGLAIDRHGRRPVMILNMIGTALVVMGWVLLLPEQVVFAGLLMVAAGVVWQGLLMARMNMELSIADLKGRSTYTAALNVSTALTGTLGGIAGGLIAAAIHGWSWQVGPFSFRNYEVMFFLCGVFRLLGVFWLLGMEDAGAKPVSVMARQVAMSVLNSAPVSVMRPIRRLGRPGGWLRRSRRWHGRATDDENESTRE
jgi:MFS family permease